MRVSKDRIDMDDKTLQKPVFKDYGESVVTANSSTSYTINLTLGNVFDITLTGNCAFTFSNPSASGTACSFTLYLTQDATGSRTVTWPSAVSWLGASTPTLYTNADSINVFTFLTINGGATWFGASAGGENAVPPFVYLDYGYFAGGAPTPLKSTVDRIDYANDTATAVAKGPLTTSRYGVAANGNSSYGYFAGGFFAPANRSTIDRLDYSNDTATTVAKGPLPAATSHGGASGTSTYGYISGGGGSKTYTSRIDYANDTATASTKAPLSIATYYQAATGTSVYGYYAGGYQVPSPYTYSYIQRLDYSNDTATTATKGPLSVATHDGGATGHSSYGYVSIGGGIYSPAYSTIDRIDYANDTATAVTKGPLGQAMSHTSGAGNSSYGYIVGRASPSVTLSTVYRIDYSNDTATTPTKGPLSEARYWADGLQSNPL